MLTMAVRLREDGADSTCDEGVDDPDGAGVAATLPQRPGGPQSASHKEPRPDSAARRLRRVLNDRHLRRSCA
jgi:hypothetical protein